MPRFIPACAGNTLANAAEKDKLSVHPRMCGEHTWRRATTRCVAGSSPHVRGTQNLIDTHTIEPRFIPACAGNTADAFAGAVRVAVHPRMCGEHPRFVDRRIT